MKRIFNFFSNSTVEKALRQYVGKKCVIRTYSAGVWYGTVKALSETSCILDNARRIWYWEGARSLSQLATEGTHIPKGCKFTVIIDEDPGVYLPQTIEVLPCTKQAIKSIESVKIWKILSKAEEEAKRLKEEEAKLAMDKAMLLKDEANSLTNEANYATEKASTESEKTSANILRMKAVKLINEAEKAYNHAKELSENTSEFQN